MGTLRRYHEDNLPFFVTSIVKGRRRIFHERRTAALLREALDFCRQRYGFLVLCYVIMPDHFHTIVVPRAGDQVSGVMRYVKGRFARRYNAAHGTSGAVWQPRFYDVGIRTESELLVRIRYVEENPVRAGLADQPADYPFSSAAPSWCSDLAGFLGLDDLDGRPG
jgi:REP element-mobilizing transposase RayT